MKRYSCVYSGLLTVMAFAYLELPVTASGVGPALLEINPGGVPIDKYFDANNDGGNPIILRDGDESHRVLRTGLSE